MGTSTCLSPEFVSLTEIPGISLLGKESVSWVAVAERGESEASGSVERGGIAGRVGEGKGGGGERCGAGSS